jgi:hypothetical protein
MSQLIGEIKKLFLGLKIMMDQQHKDTSSLWDQCNNELSAKLHNMRLKCIAIVECEKSTCEEAMSKLKDSCNEAIEAANKETESAKAMLFQSIREYETKLERETRHLKEEHSLQISTITDESKANCEDLSSKFKRLYRDFEAVIASGGEKEAEVSEKDKSIRQLEMKIIDLTALHDDEMSSVRSQHQMERADLIKDMLSKETFMNEKFAEERSRLQAELADVRNQLDEARKQFEQTISNETQNTEQIKTL